MDQQALEQQKTGRIKMLLMFAIVFVPAIAAAILYYGGFGIAGAQTNKGTLILPPVDIRDFSFTKINYAKKEDISEEDRVWSLLFIGQGPCDEVCEKTLFQGRQVHIRLGREANRLRRIYVEMNPGLDQKLAALIEKEHPKLMVSYGKISEVNDKLRSVTDGSDILAKQLTFLIDPLGNIMMYYPPEKTGKDMLTDIKLLLKLSKIG